MITIDYLNHASVLISVDKIKLLIDPWFSGSCFGEGWGLRFDNPKAIEMAATASHLWISHFHSDHFHLPTLKQIIDVNPGIILIGNESYNFKLNQVGQKIGFEEIISFEERKELDIGGNVHLTRYPTTGIDNMLLIRSKYGTILNYNDCNLPGWTQKRLAKKIGPIDIFMTNFNHAGKLLVSPPINHLEIKNKLKKNFVDNYKYFHCRYIFPFASYHYYKAPESIEQNESMLVLSDLTRLGTNILDIEIGNQLVFSNGTAELIPAKVCIKPNRIDMKTRSDSAEFNDLIIAAEQYIKTLQKNYWFFIYALPDLFIRITDLDITVRLSSSKGLSRVKDIEPHIAANSSVIKHWFTDLYGTDNFVVGAHFEIVSIDKIPLKWQIVFGLLIDNKLSMSAMLKMFFSLEGLRFIYNRREEILGILLERKINADYHD